MAIVVVLQSSAHAQLHIPALQARAGVPGLKSSPSLRTCGASLGFFGYTQEANAIDRHNEPDFLPRRATMPAFQFKGKALTIKQPWASAIAFAGKDVENRSWQCHYRGPLAIHAGAAFIEDELFRKQRVVRGGETRPLIDWINRGRKRYGLEKVEDSLDQSCVIAIAMLVDCVEKSSSPWYVGKWGWLLAGVIPIEPVPLTGALSIWDCKFKYRPLKKVTA